VPARALQHVRRRRIADADGDAVSLTYVWKVNGTTKRTFTSPSAVTSFAALIGEEQAADLLSTTVVAAIGPVTAGALSERGIKTTVMPETYTVPALVASLVQHFAVPPDPAG
jgi:uroporphyrinogen-III synthase